MSDYRCPDFIESYGSFLQKKEKYRIKLKEEHPKMSNHYNYVNKGIGKREYSDLYGGRCAYCGVSVGLFPIDDSFQIDHIVPQNKKVKNDLSNLAFSCRKCNQAKKEKDIVRDEKIHPDSDIIGSIFIRQKDYSVKISPEYANNEVACNYYSVLRLGDVLQSLDFALSVIHDMIELKMVKDECINDMKSLFYDILEIRNKK